jgi:hypothetical protein
MRSSKFQLFGFLKKQLADKQFSVDTDVKQAATSLPQTLDMNFFYEEI